MKIALVSDHAGKDLRKKVVTYLENKGYDVLDLGSDKDQSNYAIQGIKLGENISLKNADYGIAICGTGIGITLAANKVRGIRGAVCNEVNLAELTRQHNNANVLGLGARIIDEDKAYEIVEMFLNTEFEGGRHLDRIDAISDYEESCVDC